LVILLIELAHLSPSRRIFRVLLDLSLKADNGFLGLAFLYQVLGEYYSVRSMVHVFISSLEWDDICDLSWDLLLPLFAPLICELFIVLFLGVLLLPLAHHLVELIFIQAVLIVPEPLKHLLLVFLHFLH
jgi:hypothetical protein